MEAFLCKALHCFEKVVFATISTKPEAAGAPVQPTVTDASDSVRQILFLIKFAGLQSFTCYVLEQEGLDTFSRLLLRSLSQPTLSGWSLLAESRMAGWLAQSSGT